MTTEPTKEAAGGAEDHQWSNCPACGGLGKVRRPVTGAGRSPVPFSEWKYAADGKRYVFMGAAKCADYGTSVYVLADFASGELLWCPVEPFPRFFGPWGGGDK